MSIKQAGELNWESLAPLSAFKAILDESADPVTVIGLEHDLQYMNIASRALLKNTGISEPLSCHSLLTKSGQSCAGGNECPLSKVKAAKEKVKTIHSYMDDTGEELRVEVTANPVMDSSGNLVCIVESCRMASIMKPQEEAAIPPASLMPDIHQVSNLVAETRDQSDIIEAILSKSLKVLNCQAGMVFLWDAFEESLGLVATRGISQDTASGINSKGLTSELEFVKRASTHGEITLIPDGVQTSILTEELHDIEHLSGLAAPLRSGGRIIGAFAAFKGSPALFTREDIPLAQLLGLYGGSIIENARSYTMHLAIEGELLSHEKYLDCLSAISSDLVRAQDPWTILPEIIQRLQRTTNVSRCYYFSCQSDRNGDWICSQLCETTDPSTEPRQDSPAIRDINMRKAGFQRWLEVLARGEELQGEVSSLPKAEQKLLRQSGAKWMLILPVIYHGQLQGFIGFDQGSNDIRLGASEVSLLRSAANTISVAFERAAAVGDLEAAHTQLENILQSSTGYGIIATDLEFTILRANKLAEEIFGYNMEDIVGKPVDETGILATDPPLTTAEFSVAVGKTGVWESDIEILTEGGEHKTVNLVVSKISDSRDKQYGYTLYCRDVSELRESERRMVERQRIESIGLLAGGIAHDFNNILMGILGYASLAKDKVADTHPVFRMVSTIEKSAERAAALTRELLAYARGGQIQSIHIRIDEQVDEIINILRTILPREVGIVQDYAENLPYILADPAQIQQVVMNLCINAGDAIKQKRTSMGGKDYAGQLTLTTSTIQLSKFDQLRIGIENGQDGETYVSLTVSDNGCGMDPVVQKKIFEPFFTTKLTGRGLGLAAVDGIIRNHGGNLSVESKVGKGSTFRILLPADLSYRPTEDIEPIAVLGGKETILVVDVEEVNRQLALLTLTNLGHNVLLADDCNEGISALRDQDTHIDLVLMDINPPGTNEMEVFQTAREIFPDARVVLTSGYDEASIRELPWTEHALVFIQKPYTPDVLARAINQALTT